MSPRQTRKALWAALTLAAALAPVPQRGQPGGVVYHVSPDGDDRNPGTAGQPWRHIEWALTRPFLRGGDVIRIRGGVYRPSIEATPRPESTTDDAVIRPVAVGDPDRPIVVLPEPGETVVLSGRLSAEDWRGDGPVYYHEYSHQPVYPLDHPFQIVEDGALLYRVGSIDGLDRPGRCFVDTAARRIYLRTNDDGPPAGRRIEYSVAASAIEFRSGVRHWRVTGLKITGFRSVGVMIASGAGGIELDRMDISHIGAHRPGADPSNGYALAVYDTAGGNFIHHNNLHRTLAEAIHISQTGAGGDRYEANHIHDAGGPEWFHEGHDGRILTGPGMIVRGNGLTVRDNRFAGNGYHGLILESDLLGREGPAAPSGNRIEGNIFSRNGGNGLHADGKNIETPSRGNTIRFNLLERNNQSRRGSDGDAELRLAGNFDETVVANNTLYSEHSNGVLLNGVSRLRMVNNIAVHAGAEPRTYPLRVLGGTAGIVSDWNNWRRVTPGSLVSWNGEGFSGVEEVRARTGLERRGMSLDPRFVSVQRSHFWLRAVSPLIGRGLSDRGESIDPGAFPYRPLLDVAPAEVEFVAIMGDRQPEGRPISVLSAAGIPLAWSASAEPAWLRIHPRPDSIWVSPSLSGLGAGTYAGLVQVVSEIPDEPPLGVRITLTVLPAPPRRRGGK